MPKFCANLTTLFTELPFLDRFSAAADAGFGAVEFLFPYDHTPETIAGLLERNDLTLALFNMYAGDWDSGERGFAALPERRQEFGDSLTQAAEYLEATGCPRIHMMAGRTLPDAAALSTYREALQIACAKMGKHGANVLIEPINARDTPNYLLNDFNLAEQIIAELALPNLALQFDIYHHQIIHGDVTKGLRHHLPWIDHIQFASVPSRAEPDDEELNYPFIFAELDAVGYAGFAGAEYFPRGNTVDGLGWFAPYARPRT